MSEAPEFVKGAKGTLTYVGDALCCGRSRWKSEGDVGVTVNGTTLDRYLVARESVVLVDCLVGTGEAHAGAQDG